MNRKQFLQFFIRSSILAAMAGIVVVFVKRDNISLENECGIDFQCKKCNKTNSCSLPEAINYGENGKG